jgi:hypothetical protein
MLAQLPHCLYYLGQQIEGSLSTEGRHIPLELTGGQCLDHLSWQVVVPAVSGKPLLPAKSASGRSRATIAEGCIDLMVEAGDHARQAHHFLGHRTYVVVPR